MIPNFPQEYARAWKLPPARKVTWARVFLLIFCSSPSNTLDAQGLYFLTQCVILKYPKALYITMVHPFLIHLRFLSVLRLCVLKIVRYAILYPWPFETVFIGIILTHSVYTLLFFYFSVPSCSCLSCSWTAACKWRNKQTSDSCSYVSTERSLSLSLSNLNDDLSSYRIWLYFRIWANPISLRFNRI